MSAAIDVQQADACFATAKESCRAGHLAAGGRCCTYGGLGAYDGFWLFDEQCALNHGDACDLRVVCDGVEAAAGFANREPEGWIYRVVACWPCAEAYVAMHPEWGLA